MHPSHKPFAAFFSSSRRCHRFLFVFSFNILLQLFSSLKVLDTFLPDALFRFLSMGFIYSSKKGSQFELLSSLKEEHRVAEVSRTLDFVFSRQLDITVHHDLYMYNALLPKFLHIFDENYFNHELFESSSLSYVVLQLTLEHHIQIAKFNFKIN